MQTSKTSQTFRRSLLLALPLLAFFNMGAEGGCGSSEDSGDVAQDRIYAQYWLYYNATADKTDVRAAFRFGGELGTPLQLSSPAKVSFGTTTLGFDPNWDWHHTEVAMLADNGTIIYVDKDGKQTNVSTGTFSPIAFADAPLSFDRTSSATLAWQGTPLEAGEYVELWVADAKNLTNFVGFTATAPGATSVVVTPDKLSQIPAGAATFSFKRHKVTRPDAKTKLHLSYESRNAMGGLR